MVDDATPPLAVELEPCPFCGKQPYSDWQSASPIESFDEGYWGIECCYVYIYEDTEAEAIAAWNARHRTEALARAGWGEAIEAAAKVVEDLHGKYSQPTDWDYGAQDACVAIAAAIRALAPGEK